MGILDQVKNIADSVGSTVSKGAKTGTDNLKKMAEKSKIKREIAMIEADINTGGIAGAMGIENEYDKEGAISSIKNAHVNGS